MSELPSRAANRLRKPSWRDSRLIAGVLIVLLSTVGGALVISQLNTKVPVYAARGVLMPGEPLTEANLIRVDVQLGDEAPRYLSAASALPPEQYVLREVRAGELLPTSSIGSKDTVAVQPLTVQVDATSATALTRGSIVDLYVNPPRAGTTGQEFAGPQRLVESAGVVAQPEDSGGFGGGTGEVAVRILIPTDKVASVIENVDMGAKVTVVPVPGSLTRNP